jgi:hypothetical protein
VLAARVSGLAVPIAIPNFLQNHAPGLTGALHPGQVSSSFDPHPSQYDASAGLSLLHFVQSIWLRAKFLKQGLRIFEVGGVEALGEPAVNVGERRARLVAMAGVAQQMGEAHRRAQLK